MKKKVSILALAVVASLASCSSDGVDSNPNFPADGIIRVTTGVDAPTSRVGQDANNLTMFNLNVSNATAPTYSYYACMKKDPNNSSWGSFSSNNPEMPLVMKWQDDQTLISVIAFGVNNTNILSTSFLKADNYSVETDQNTANDAGFNKSDVLYLNQKDINPKDKTLFDTSGRLKLNLLHRLSLLEIKLNFTNEFEAMNPKLSGFADIKDFKVNNLNIGYSFNPSTDELKLREPAVCGDIIPHEKKDGFVNIAPMSATYECIVVPQDKLVDVLGVSFRINNNAFSWTFKQADVATLPSFEKGKKYTLSLNVGKEVVMGSFSASPWGVGGSNDYDVK